MKSKKILIAVSILMIVGILWLGLNNRTSKDLVNPLLGQSKPTPSETPFPNPTPAVPKTFNFDSQTDLQAELEKINPEILDSDFE